MKGQWRRSKGGRWTHSLGWEAIRKPKTAREKGYPVGVGWKLYYPRSGLVGFFKTLKQVKTFVEDINDRATEYQPDYLLEELMPKGSDDSGDSSLYGLSDYGASF